ncbi:YbaN family protein [soil metagenome]
MKDTRLPRLLRALLFALGFVFVALGVIGAFLPVLPTTPFLILAAACFARSSPRFEAWLLKHERFGPTLRAWRSRGAIPRKAKMAAFAGMIVGFTLFWIVAHPGLPLALAVAGLMLTGLAYVLSRPS